jgi:ATP-dependent helicase/nuclease subunit A
MTQGSGIRDQGSGPGTPAFTSCQLEAIDIERRHLDTCVVAGPGSGKTTVLVEYFKRLVGAGVDPLRILAITFTEKAAGNMRKKLADAFQEDSGIRAALERAWVSTVHGFCARLLRESAVFAGVDPEFYVADERQSWRAQQDSMAAAMESLFAEHPAAVRALIRGLSSIEFEEAVLSAYDAMRGAGLRLEELAAITPPAGVTIADVAATLAQLRKESLGLWSPDQKQFFYEVLEDADRIVNARGAGEALAAAAAFSCNLQKCKRGTGAYELLKFLRKEQVEKLKYTLITEHYAPERQLLLEILRRFDHLYRERKRQAGALDFSDLEEFTVRLLDEHQETRARLQGQFDHILMDEFQDTNGQQAKLLRLIRPPDRFYAVGDINQSIFGFRHAEPEGFAAYRDEVERSGRRLVELTDNFRSRAEILSAVETIVGGKDGIVDRPLIAGRKFDAPRPVAVELMYVAPGEQEEAQWVARRILELLRDEPGFAYRDVAVLVRNTEVLPAFSQAFDESGIPYLVNRGRGFYDTREVNDLTHLLRSIANPRDEISLATVLRSPLVAVSDEALLELRVLGENIGASLMRLSDEHAPGFSPADFEALCRFRDRLRQWRARREYRSFDRLLLAAIDECGYRPASGGRGDANVDKFLAQAREASARMSLDEFVEELQLVRESNPREPDAPPEDSANAVKVMTVHSAKGLEFPIVFVATLHKGIETKPPVVAFSRHFGLGARWRIPGTRDEKDDLFQHAIREERKRRETEEGHRLLYVAMTRAEQHLVLSFSGKKPGNWASVVSGSLALDLEGTRDEVVDCTSPDGKPWKLRVLVTDRGPEVVRAAPREEAADTTELVTAPTPGGQHDSAATVTALATFAACPRKYYLGSYVGFEGHVHGSAQSNGGLAAAELGSQVHALLAGTAVTEPDAEAVRLANVFRQSALGRRAAKAARIEREFDFLLAVEELVIRGQVDLWFEEGGELVIVDYKTDAVTGMQAHQRAQDYALQLRLYAMAVERVAGRAPDRAWLHFLRPNTVIPVDLTPSLLESPEQTVRDFVEAQAKQEFPLREGAHCKSCQFYKDLCPAGVE